MEIKIEKVKLEEIPEVKKLLSETWIDTYGSFLSPETIQKVTSVWHDPKLLAQQAENPNIFFGVAKDNEKLVGLITIRRLDNDTIMMNRLYVHPKYQRKGIGSKLAAEALKVFPNASKMRLEVEEKNGKGHSFYVKQGFQEIERKIDKVDNEEMRVIVMEKGL